MKAVFFFLYLAFGAGAAYGAHTYLAQDWMIAGGGGVFTSQLARLCCCVVCMYM